MKKFLVILLLIFITSGIAVAYAPSLKIRDTDLDCDEDLFDGGYDSCTLSIDLRIDDYSYSSQYDNYTYKVECEEHLIIWMLKHRGQSKIMNRII